MLKKTILAITVATMSIAANSVFADADGDYAAKPGVKLITTVPVYVGAGSL